MVRIGFFGLFLRCHVLVFCMLLSSSVSAWFPESRCAGRTMGCLSSGAFSFRILTVLSHVVLVVVVVIISLVSSNRCWNNRVLSWSLLSVVRICDPSHIDKPSSPTFRGTCPSYPDLVIGLGLWQCVCVCVCVLLSLSLLCLLVVKLSLSCGSCSCLSICLTHTHVYSLFQGSSLTILTGINLEGTSSM